MWLGVVVMVGTIWMKERAKKMNGEVMSLDVGGRSVRPSSQRSACLPRRLDSLVGA